MPSNAHPSAGVYTNTIDLSQRIAAVSSSIGAVVGGSPKGPVMTPTLVTDHVEFESYFGKGDPSYGYMYYAADPFLTYSNRMYAVRVVNQALTAGAYLTVDDPQAASPTFALTNFDAGAGDNTPLGKDDPLTNLGFSISDPGVQNILGYFVAIDPGKWNDRISVGIKPAAPKGVPVTNPPANGHDPMKFIVEVYLDYKGGIHEQPAEIFTVTRHEEVDELNKQLFIEDVINSGSNLIRFKNNALAEDIPVYSAAFETFSGGDDGIAPTNDMIIQAWALLEDTDRYDINILINAGYASPDIQREMDRVATQRGDAIAVLDLPSSKQKTADAIAYKVNELNLDSSFSAIYGSDVLIYDTVTSRKIYVPLSGYVAASIAFTDSNRGLWFAPAGISRGKLAVLGVREHYNQGARDAFDENQINPVRKITGQGYVIWGQLTTQRRTTSLQNVNVRRLTNFILKSTSIAAKYKVFDPNDDFTRAELRNMVERFLEPIKRGRGIYEYKVNCDSKNNPNFIIANGDLVLDMYYDPTIAVKRVHIVFNINPTGSTATEA